MSGAADGAGGVGGPGGQQPQAVVRRRARLGGPDDDLQVGIGGPGDGVPVEVQVPDDGVAQVFGAGVAGGDVVGGPPLPELGVLDREFAHELGQLRVARVVRVVHPHLGDGQPGDSLPVRVELAHGRVGDEQADVVALLLGDLARSR